MLVSSKDSKRFPKIPLAVLWDFNGLQGLQIWIQAFPNIFIAGAIYLHNNNVRLTGSPRTSVFSPAPEPRGRLMHGSTYSDSPKDKTEKNETAGQDAGGACAPCAVERA